MTTNHPSGPRRRLLLRLATGLLATACGRVWAIDNPDTPDLPAQFEARCLPFEKRIQNEATTTAEINAAYRDYEQFLDRELNSAYSGVLARLDGEPKRALVLAQRQWLKFRDAETAFIHRNWTTQNFGTSSALSRASYRSSLVKDRVRLLLQYLVNYPPAGR